MTEQAAADIEPETVDSPDDGLPFEREGPIYDECGAEAGEDGAVIAVEWFAAPKRALLAPFGVGTIDQALLGILQTKHFFVRLFGLAGKTVIVDEVHAYDTYMSALLYRLLEWLGAFGVPVVLLSATLPSERRKELRAAYAQYAGWPAAEDGEGDAPYPRVTWLSAAGVRTRPVRASSDMSRRVDVEWLHSAPPDSAEGLAALGDRLHALLADGGCAAVICNTVTRAQNVYEALRGHFDHAPEQGRPDLDLFHARFPRGAPDDPASRAEREGRVIQRFGKGKDGEPNPERPQRAVVVATQVIEQSLDLDFDLMVSDFAPVDLLLQRSGRLHRHSENNPRRPEALKKPRLIIPRPEMRDGCPRFPLSDEFIYDAHALLRTWLALQRRTGVQVPGEIEELIEQVYRAEATCPADEPDAIRGAWEQTRREHEREMKDELNQARVRQVASPKDDTVYTGRNLDLKEEDETQNGAPEAEQIALALTRLGPPTVRVVLLPEQQARREWQTKGKPPGRKATRDLLRRSVPISHGAVAPALIGQEEQYLPTRWKKSPWLRHTRLVALGEGDQATIWTRGKGGANARSYTLRLDPDLGVVIRRQGEPEE